MSFAYNALLMWGAENPPELSLRTRLENIDRMRREVFDIAVIGGGITGAGIALDATLRGLKVALVERRDFSSGTSSRSTKLIHGGLRYLERFEFGLVREALRERAALMRIAPHLCQPMKFLVPVYGGDIPSPLGANRFKLGAGLWVYDLLAGRENIARHRWLSRDQALQLAPALMADGLRGAFLYYDCLTNDARLVIEVIKAAAQRGAAVANYAAARCLLKDRGRICGLEVEDALGHGRFQLQSRIVINAAGVWADQILSLDEADRPKVLRPSKGIHIVMPADKFQLSAAALIPSLGERRFLFVIPWLGRIIIGTTDSDYSGDLDEPRAEEAEIERLMKSAARYFPGSHISREDLISSFAGLRPLVAGGDKPTADLSRREEIIERGSGLISIVGGKLTTYRRMAERVVKLAMRRLGLPEREPEQVELAGGAIADLRDCADRAAAEFGAPIEMAEHLCRTYGGNHRAVLAIARDEGLTSRLVEELPHIEAEAIYAARCEMAATVEDVLRRRTPIALLARDGGRSCRDRVAELMRRELGGLLRAGDPGV